MFIRGVGEKPLLWRRANMRRARLLFSFRLSFDGGDDREKCGGTAQS